VDTTSTTDSQTASPPARRNPGTFYFISSVMGVAFLVATLFTFWSDPGLLPFTLGQSGIPLNIGPQATQTAASQGTPTSRTRPLVGIVVGHWDDSTKDPGAVCSDVPLTEFQVNQTVSALVRDQLIARAVDVEMLREFDPKLNGYQASALVSIHADTCDYINEQATGFKVSAAMANPRPQLSARLTACLRQRYALATGLEPHNSITADMTSYHAFDEINEDTTAAIIEVGFLNLDRELLTRHPDRVAQGIVDGIMCFLDNEEIPFATTPQATGEATPSETPQTAP
jgi:N-acetylmuramoyl-L-alanine amidase